MARSADPADVPMIRPELTSRRSLTDEVASAWCVPFRAPVAFTAAAGAVARRGNDPRPDVETDSEIVDAFARRGNLVTTPVAPAVWELTPSRVGRASACERSIRPASDRLVVLSDLDLRKHERTDDGAAPGARRI